MAKGLRIVVGTDFSSGSQNALGYAAALCQELSAKMIVVHAYKSTGKAGALTMERHIRKTIKEEIRDSLKEIKGKYPELRIEIVMRKSEPKEAMLWATSKFKALIMVVGTQGVHEDPDLFIGSTTGALIKFGNAPVLAIPNKCSYTPVRELVFAVKNPFVASEQVVAPLLRLQEFFKARITLLHVTQDSTPDLSRYPNPYSVEPHTHALHISESDNIYQSLQDYLQHNSADMLIVISRLRGFFEGLFAQSSTRADTFNSELPILVLHGGVRE